MNKIPTKNVLAISIGIIIITILLVFLVSIRQSQRVKNTLGQVAHTENILQHIQKVIMAALDNETGARGYVITGHEHFLQPLRTSEEHFNTELQQLQQLVTDPRNLQWLDSARYYIGKRIAFSDSMVLVRREQGLAAAAGMVEGGRGKQYTDHIRRIGNEMEQVENELLVHHKKTSDITIRQLNTILYTVLVGVLLLSVFIIRRIRADINRQQLNEQKFSALLNAAPDATVIVDENGIIQLANLQLKKLFGYAPGEISGRPVEILIPAELHHRHVRHRDGFIKEARVRVMGEGIELKAVKKNGDSFPVEISLSPIHTKEGLLVSASIRDITARKKGEEEIRKLNTELEERVKSRTAALEASVKETEDYKYALDESSIVAITDQKGAISYVNDNFCAISGYSREELIGQDHRIINSGHHPKEFIRDLWVTIANGKIWRGELKNKAKNGTFYWVDTTIVPFLDAAGKPYRYVAIRADITKRKETEERLVKSEKIYRTIASSIPGSVICLLDAEYRYLLIEGDMLEKLGYSKQALLGNKAADVLPPETFANVVHEFESVLQGDTITRETSMAGYDIISRFIPLKDGNNHVYAIMTVAIDITELKNAQRDIIELNLDLEKRIAARTEELRKTNQELEAFSYSVSHDLRAPLRGIIAFAKILEEEYSSRLDEEAKRITSIIRDSTLKMGNLIDDLLAFSRMGKQGIMKVQVNMEQMVDEIVADMVHQQANPHAITWHIHNLAPAGADVNTIRQVWINLISNAIKYSGNRQQPHIEISAYPAKHEVVFYVRDNGAGFDEAYKDKLFKVFQRLHDADEFEGTGIGLALVEKIISRHGGRVWAEGKEDAGACFYFSLPINTNIYEP